MTIIDLAREPQHLSILAKWHQAEWADLNPGETLAKRIDRMQAYLSTELVPTTFVFKHEGLLAGSAALVHSDMDSRPALTPWLASVFVAPGFRRRGIGASLVKHVMRQAQAAGLDQLYLFTPDQAAFYNKLGWRAMAEEIYRGQQVTVMTVTLSEYSPKLMAVVKAKAPRRPS